MTVVSDAQIRDLVRTLPIPSPWDRNLLIERLAADRGRPIKLMAIDANAFVDSPCGLWISFDHEDWICHEAETTDYHVDQIVCHEIGHMVLGHKNLPQFTDDKASRFEWCRNVAPTIDPTAVRAIYGRTSRSVGEERDAEMFAHLLMVAAAETRTQPSMMSSVFFR